MSLVLFQIKDCDGKRNDISVCDNRRCFVCIVVYVVWKVKNGGKTGGCSCCDIKDCKLKQTKRKKIVVNVVKTTDFFC